LEVIGLEEPLWVWKETQLFNQLNWHLLGKLGSKFWPKLLFRVLRLPWIWGINPGYFFTLFFGLGTLLLDFFEPIFGGWDIKDLGFLF